MYKDKYIAGYIRVSTEMQAERDSIINQEDAIKSYIKSRDKPYKIYKDIGISAKNKDRPGFKSLIKDIEANKIDSIVVNKLDRITRSLKDLLYIKDLCEEYNVSFISLTQNLDTSTPMGRFSFYVLGLVAQLEREVTAERVAENMIARAKRKKWNGGVIPFGFYWIPDKKTIQIDPKEAELINKIYNFYLEYKSFRKTTHTMNSLGYRTRKDKYWASTSITRILQNPIYYGALTYNKRKSYGKTSKPRPKKEHLIIENVFEPIIEKSKWEKVQNIIKEILIPPRTKSSPYILSGLVKCGFCGTKMYGWKGYTNKGRKIYSYYKCNGSISKGKSFCLGNSIAMETLENMVEKELKEIALKPNNLKSKLRNYEKEFNADSETFIQNKKRLENNINKLEKKVERTFELYEDNLINKNEFAARKVKLDQDKSFCESELRTLDEKLSSSYLTYLDMDKIINKVKNLADIYYELNFDEKKQLLRCLFDKIIIKKDEIECYLTLYPELLDWKRVDNMALKALHPLTVKTCIQKPKPHKYSSKPKTIGEKIYNHRIDLGLKQKDVANFIRVDSRSISNWENNRRKPLKKFLPKINSFLSNSTLKKGS